MKGTIFWVMFATASLLGCGKSEEPAITPPAVETPQPAEVAPVEAAPAQAESAEPVAAPMETPPVKAPTTAAPDASAQPVAAQPAPTTPVSAAPKPDLARGQQIYRQACAFCHDKGVAGAPKLGDAAAWSARLAQGIDALYNTALRGKGAMPAKGGNPSLADADVKSAVDFLAAQAR